MFLLALENSALEILSGSTGLENCRLEHAAILHSTFRILSGTFVLENRGLEHAVIVQRVPINALAGSLLENQCRSGT